MKTISATESQDNILPLPIVAPKPKRAPIPTIRQRFTLREFINGSGKTRAWRVEGSPRSGKRIRENYPDLALARARQIQLESEYHSRTQDSEPDRRATKLSDIQLRLCEAALFKLGSDDELLPAIDHWLTTGKQNAVRESPKLDEAFKKFKAWLDGAKDENGNGICTLREHTRRGLRIRVNVFCNNIPNLRVDAISTDTIEDFLGKLKVGASTRLVYHRSISRFFTWCIARPRRWLRFNPCGGIEIAQGEQHPPKILTVEQSGALLKAAESKGLGAHVALLLFAGLRPNEALRLSWEQINLADKEIRLEGHQTKTGRQRVVTICPTLASWLKAYSDEPLLPEQWGMKFKEAKAEAKLLPWVPDIARHTAVSHYFRKTGSYGQTAEQFGNSEAIIKQHYQGRVSSEDTKKFYALRPTKGGAK